MADETKQKEQEDLKQGQKVFQTICSMLDKDDWKYDKDENKLEIKCSARGDDLPIRLRIRVLPDRKVVNFYSPIFNTPEDKRSEMAVAVCVANYALIIGCFDFDIRDGEVSYRLTAAYRDSILSETVFHDLLYTTCLTVDDYNDKLFALSQNMMSLTDFVNFVHNK